jgi:hypothetical protein
MKSNKMMKMNCQQCGKTVKKPIPLDALRSSTIPPKYDSVEFWESREKPSFMCAECYNKKVESRLGRKPIKGQP